MKNLINYYYNFSIDNYTKSKDCICFSLENVNYEFMPFYGNFNELYKIYLIVLRSNKYCHQFVLNKNKEFITYYNGTPYILIKKIFYLNKKVDLMEIINYDAIVQEPYINNWKNLWSEKIDYYEYQINELSEKYKILSKSLNYYIGLSECAISLLNSVDKKSIKCYICHKRILFSEKLDEFFNPINLIVDSRVRDIAEFIKSSFFNGVKLSNNTFIIINNLNFSKDEFLLFFSRLMYPSYYFDMFDEILIGKYSEDKIYSIIKKNIEYQDFIFNIYLYYSNNYNLPKIDWGII